MDQLVVGPHRRGAGPHLVIEVFRRRDVGRVVARPHVVVAADFDQADLAKHAFLEDGVAGLDEVRRAAPLGADLHNAFVLPGSRHHGLPLGDVHADRFLHVDVGAGLDGRDHGQGVPVVRSADEHDVEVLFLEHVAVVAMGAWLLFRLLPLGNEVGGLGQHPAIDVAQRHDLDRGDLNQAEQVALAVPATADQADARRFGICQRGQGGRGGQGQRRGAGVQKVATIHDDTSLEFEDSGAPQTPAAPGTWVTISNVSALLAGLFLGLVLVQEDAAQISGWHALRYSEGRGLLADGIHALRSTSGRATHGSLVHLSHALRSTSGRATHAPTE